MPSDNPALQHLPGTSRTLHLDTDLTIIHIAGLRLRLLAWLADGEDGAKGDGHLDLSAVDAIDTAGVQLLLALRRSLVAAGRTLVIHAPTAAITDVLTRYGLADTLLARPAQTEGSHGPR